MSSKLNLSHSQISTYKDCQRKYYLQRIERIRPTYTGSSLIFGSAIDATTEHILLNFDSVRKEDLGDTFLKAFNSFEVNRKPKKLPEDVLDVKFFVSAVDANLVSNESLTADYERLELDVDLEEFLEYCKEMRKSKKALPENEQELFNTIAYRSLIEKANLINEALFDWLKENVKEAVSVQKKIEMEDGEGNKIIGYLDFILTMKDGRRLLIDLKTSSNPKLYYPTDSASKSPQLALYAVNEELYEVAYLVVDTKVRKREPRIRLHFIEGKIDDEMIDETFDEISTVTHEIYEKLELGKGVFEQNKDACSKFGKCPYIDLCWKGSMKGLEKT